MNNILLVGAGKAEIEFPKAAFPTVNENYTEIHDNPLVQAVLIEAKQRTAIVAVGVVILGNRDEVLAQISRDLELEKSRIILHTVHVLSTPHQKRIYNDQDILDLCGGKVISEEEAEELTRKQNMMCGAILEAVHQACLMAKGTVRRAFLKTGMGSAPVNVNRVVKTDHGWWQGVNFHGETDHSIPVLHFHDEEKKTIAVLYSVNMAPGVLENSYLADGGRAVSADIAGASIRFVESHLGRDSVAVYLTGATGDQWPIGRALLDSLDAEGRQTVVDLHEEGYSFVQMIGTRLGEEVLRVLKQTEEEKESIDLKLQSWTLSYPMQICDTPTDLGAVTECTFEEKGTCETEITILSLGDIAIVSCGGEIGVRTYRKIKENSPFDLTILLEFAVKKSVGYMAEQDMYDKMSYQSRKTKVVKGTAERFGEDVLRCLNILRRESQGVSAESAT